MSGKEIIARLDSAMAAETFARLYGIDRADEARRRYRLLIEEMLRDSPGWFPQKEYPEIAGDLHIFSAPGRTELGGNHTDHNHGKVLAASIQLDAVAIVAPRQDRKVFFRSRSHRDVTLDLADTAMRPEEKGTTEALIRGIAAEFVNRGSPIGGFTVNAENLVLTGSGLSSSAAVEVLFGRIFDCLFGRGGRSALEIAQIGQKAENNYFGKPCGLMDQTACASGGAIAIDFEDPAQPELEQVDFDLASVNTALCVVDTRGSHSDLTPDYAAIPGEMKAAAACLGKTVLRELDLETVLDNAEKIRKTAGDRALLRAIHFFNENPRVDAMLSSLREMNAASSLDGKQRAFGAFLTQVQGSADSSWELLQNIYAPHEPRQQGVSLGLALTRNFLEKECGNQGACRVHGGGFAGTIQAYIPLDGLLSYRSQMEKFFGPGSVTVLRIRPIGAVELKL